MKWFTVAMLCVVMLLGHAFVTPVEAEAGPVLQVLTAPFRLVARVIGNGVERRQERRESRRAARCHSAANAVSCHGE